MFDDNSTETLSFGCNVGSLGSKDGVLAIIHISGLYICVSALLKTLYKMLYLGYVGTMEG